MRALDQLPSYFKEDLLTFLEDEEQLDVLKEQLHKTSIVIEDGQYQISIDSIEELNEIIRRLKKICVFA